jgi:hypothetical protein
VAERDIAVKFTGDSRDLERAADKADRSVSETGKSMGGSLAGLAGPAAIAATAIAGIGFVAFKLADAAMEDEAAASQLAQQLHQAAGASDEAVKGAEDYIAVLSKQVAIADDDLRPALSKLATATGDVAKAQDLLSLATDISAGTGKDLASVTDALVKAQLGSTGGLARMGIATKDADGNALSLEDTLARARETFKGAGEAAAQTSAGGLRNAQIQFGELQEAIGAKLLPVLGGLAEVFVDKVIPAGQAVVAWAEGEWPKIMEQIGPSLADLQATTAEVFAAVTAFWTEWGDEITRIAEQVFVFWVEEMVVKLRVFVAFVRYVVDELKSFWAEWGDEITFVAGLVAGAATLMAAAIGYAMFAIQWAVRTASAVLSGDWATAWERVQSAVATGIEFVRGLMAGWGASIAGALSGVAEIIKRPFIAAFNAIADAWNSTIGSLHFTFEDWIPGLGGKSIDVPDVPRFSSFAGLTIVMPAGSDGYDVTRQVASFSRNVAPVAGLTVAVR